MTERQRTDIRSAIIGAAVSLLIALATLATTYGRLTEQVGQIGKDVDRIVVAVDVQRTQTATLCERIAALEAKIQYIQTQKGTP